MADFAEVVPIGEVLKPFGIDYAGRDFESVYSRLAAEPEFDQVRLDLEEMVREYFGNLELPAEPTDYDLLLLSLRPKDLLATFNWDPFLLQALDRTRCIRPENSGPELVFLHGNVATAY